MIERQIWILQSTINHLSNIKLNEKTIEMHCKGKITYLVKVLGKIVDIW